MRFLLLFFADDAAGLEMPEAKREAAVERIGVWFGTWFGALAPSGIVVEGHRLRSGLQSGQATSHVRLGLAGRSGKPLVTDGPFIETKESISSYAIILARDQAAALAIASSWPAAGAVEVRALAE